jgi:hypothetical protein
MEVNNSLPSGTILRGISNSYRIEKTLGQGSFSITNLATTKLTVMGKLGKMDTTVNVAIKNGNKIFLPSAGGHFSCTKGKSRLPMRVLLILQLIRYRFGI